ncbi:MAG: nucleotidyltransferase domain-containing protein [Candidatus Sungbacteria bacterium]|nr:nucleotidyltransferase domain-containing protein [Candidatus Sungbacteria bacterium]
MERIIVEQKIKEVVDKIVAQFQPEKIILFGSYAWGTPHEDSDVDFFVIKTTVVPRRERKYELRHTLFPSPFAFDVLIYTPEELQKSINENRNLFIEDILRNGKVLYERPDGAFAVDLPARPLTVLS